MLASLMQIEEFMAASRKQEKPVHIVTNIKHPETVQVTRRLVRHSSSVESQTHFQ